MSVAYNDTAKRPENPDKAGFKFIGWYKQIDEETTETEKYDFTTPVTEDITLVAKWAYAIGAKGPAGGYIFYDVDADNDDTENDGLKSSVLGWWYLEAAPSDLSKDYIFGFYRLNGSNAEVLTENNTSIGTGKSNTEALVKAMGDTAYTSDDGNETTSEYAVKACSDYIYGGKDDWFLPSIDELKAMYDNLYEKEISSFKSDKNYWSSSEYSNGNFAVYTAGFNDKYSKDEYGRTSLSCYVRPIRSF